MMSRWQTVQWGDIASLEYGKGLSDYQKEKKEYPVYGTNGPIGWHTIPLCSHPGVIIGRKGAYRGIHYSKTPFYVIDTAFYLLPKIELDVRWAYYELLTHDINGMDSGSAIPSTSRDDFYAMSVSVPPIDEQRAIARMLGALDDKIELNHRMSKTLEHIATAIFKSWFVDFDPVVAKSEGRKPFGMIPEVAALFPNSFVETEDGPIPKGWSTDNLNNIADITSGKRPNHRSPIKGNETEIPLYGAGGIMSYVKEPLYNHPIIIKNANRVILSCLRV